MSVPNAVYLDCPNCDEHAVHEVLKGKLGRKQEVLEATVKCQECGQVYVTVVREPEHIRVPIVISERGTSKKDHIELMSGDMISVDDEVYLGENHLLITAIESDGRRVQSSAVEDVDTLWAKRFDKVIVKISVNKHSRTLAAELEALPDEEFYVGDLMTVGRDNVVIHNIRSKEGTVRRGGVPARDIVRIYTKAVRSTKA
ncbi:MAG TPA: HVO_0476 family zinc finger protein [Methanomassiliicoccaceae archaeon]|jgi:uncharacterized Zn finger protein|nr:hypothetical protein [Euryarchaeota archaeon]HOB38904.1 HVO_0476 family zinc finger protein [Methanomassiliicoccaceae archaeon]HOK27725.1 HVO_0476 family zinc finger protein [Methanomassiliicoccaceae archaeon]HOL07955.1 HVO_0476 family zinc finger protein [Methanomassiliicoccaceae archaeon]HOQ26178.1 HVO_0476 family zinc finger protein [Methanomassiliicoccaceae archaeon]